MQPAQQYPASSDRPHRREEPVRYGLDDDVDRDDDSPEEVDDTGSDADRMRAEVESEEAEVEKGWPAGTVALMLYTADGEALIHVPPRLLWRSTAVRAINLDDSLTWAMSALSVDEAMRWQELDPTSEESAKFFRAWGKIIGQSPGESRASRRSSKSTRGR